MVKFVDRAQVTTATAGTGNLILGSARQGYQSFAAAGVQDGETVRYVIEDGEQWEIGLGVYTVADNSLTRSPTESSNAGALVVLSGQPAIVYVTAAASDIAQLNAPAQFTSVQLTGGTEDQGTITWNEDFETLDVIQNGAVLPLGQETQVHVRNNTGEPIPKGVAVRATGALGNSGRVTVDLMVADGSVPARFFLGISEEEIAADDDGKIVTFGKIKGVNTSAYADGTVLWLDPATPGGFTATEPSAPNLKIAVAFVVSSANNGVLLARSDHGVRVADAHDVEVSAPADGEALIWDETNTRWTNYALTTRNVADIDVSGKTNGSVLVYNGATSKFEATVSLADQIIVGGFY
jgi:hypothetical protein